MAFCGELELFVYHDPHTDSMLDLRERCRGGHAFGFGALGDQTFESPAFAAAVNQPARKYRNIRDLIRRQRQISGSACLLCHEGLRYLQAHGYIIEAVWLSGLTEHYCNPG